MLFDVLREHPLGKSEHRSISKVKGRFILLKITQAKCRIHHCEIRIEDQEAIPIVF